MKGNKRDALSIPNILSYIRILLVPVFAVMYLTAHTTWEYLLAALILLLSGLTDLCDGYIARHFDMITNLGKVLDPAADKLTQATVAVCLAIRIEGMALLLTIFIAKEVIMAGASIFLMSRGGKINGSQWFGKLATAVFYSVMVLIVAIPGIDPAVRVGMIALSAALMIFALISYVPTFFMINKEIKAGRSAPNTAEDTEEKNCKDA
ncbi:CDP-alcohol phosphatidyltransferase family protein [Acetanaerobacterium elongatum]|uniref:CDP-diacylglycerol--glycerol-3-phosphate 3-phosphatidyltransferase n=1 Tax=Acetanaerobacterium elongatum TaxID=258515 RepID=A0A1G9V852_9FIRM|nr:CDP-alcohol phosphatidyltransferase family protein [Acetanaerobacterium elongatum]SDM68273.1 cardiolipin synthase [Acetanaerobacterium elongatum]